MAKVTPGRPGSREFILKEFQFFANRQLREARMTAFSKAGEIRRLHSTAGVTFREQFMEETLHDLCEVFDEGPTSFEEFLSTADALRDEDRRNNNASPELFSTPLPYRKISGSTTGLPPKPPKMKSTLKKAGGGIFPSVKQMIGKVSPSICSGMDVYQFVGAGGNVPITPKPKAPRNLKPGEIVFSQTGSPIYVSGVPDKQFPSTPGNNAIEVDRPVRLQVPDPKGAFDVELVFRGDPHDPSDAKKARAFKGFVTDVRGLISTRSTVRSSKRLMDLRVPVKSKSATKKKPRWHAP